MQFDRFHSANCFWWRQIEFANQSLHSVKLSTTLTFFPFFKAQKAQSPSFRVFQAEANERAKLYHFHLNIFEFHPQALVSFSQQRKCQRQTESFSSSFRIKLENALRSFKSSNCEHREMHWIMKSKMLPLVVSGQKWLRVKCSNLISKAHLTNAAHVLASLKSYRKSSVLKQRKSTLSPSLTIKNELFAFFVFFPN